jgi:hypothetical protein
MGGAYPDQIFHCMPISFTKGKGKRVLDADWCPKGALNWSCFSAQNGKVEK